MLFNSPQFMFLFLPIVFSVYFLLASLARPVASRVWLTLSSVFFYGYWNPWYIPLIFVTLIVNFILGTLLTSYKYKVLLVAGILFNLSLLGYYKYLDFILINVNALLPNDIPLLHLTLPLAISFYTFQQITYIVDCYKDKAIRYSFINYTLFVTFFPHLIAGPLVHHHTMMPQFMDDRNKKINFELLSLGIFVFAIGLFKKVLLADHLSATVLTGLTGLPALTLFDAWLFILSYTLQLYFDFSGYSDMAVGLALLFNIKLPENFKSPYRTTNFQDLVSRWHITLTRFLYEYVYFPMNRFLSRKVFPSLSFKVGTNTKTNINLILLFVCSGLWHGAGWNFILWGFLMGTGVCIYRIWSRLGMKLPAVLAWFLTFGYLNVTLVFFKLDRLDQAKQLLKAMFGFNGVNLPPQWAQQWASLTRLGVTFAPSPMYGGMMPSLLAAAGLILVVGFKNTFEQMEAFRPGVLQALFTIVLLLCSILSLTKVTEFLYFRF